MYTILKINLAAFDGGGGAAAPAAAQGGQNAAGAPPQTGGASAPQGGKAARQASQGAGASASQAGQAPRGQEAGQAPQEGQAQRPTFDELIRGEYRQEYDERVREIVTRRLQSSRAELDAVRPILAILQQRYGVEDGEGAAGAVLEALRKDDAYWESAAEKAGMTAEQYRKIVTIEARNRELQAVIAAQQTEQRRNEAYRRLSEEAEQVRAAYPGFDVEAELRSGSAFGELVRNGVDMLTAYRVCHQEEFLAEAQRQAEGKAQAAVAANQARPRENGSGSGQPAKLSGDPSKWTREQFRDVERRVQRGERIVL